MEFRALFMPLLAIIFFPSAFAFGSVPFQDNWNGSVVLDNMYNNTVDWDFPTISVPKWFEYYNDSSIFNNDSGNPNVCASIPQDFEKLSEKVGIWVACQDPDLPSECYLYPKSPCHPVMKYDTGELSYNGIRTVKMSFAIYGLAILRLHASGQCFDYSYRQDTFSSCEFLNVTEITVSEGWLSSQFIFDPLLNLTFHTFEIEFIARFAHDVVLLDSVQASKSLLCGNDHCTTTVPPSTTRQTYFPVTIPTTIATTEDDGISDPDIWTTTTPKNACYMLTSTFIVALTFSFLVCYFNSL